MASCLREDGVGVGGSWVFIKICKLFNDHHDMGVYFSSYSRFLGKILSDLQGFSWKWACFAYFKVGWRVFYLTGSTGPVLPCCSHELVVLPV